MAASKPATEAAASRAAFRVGRGALAAELAHVAAVIERKQTLPILANVFVEANAGAGSLRIVATDLEVTIDTTIPAAVESSGTLLVDAKRLYEIVKALPDGQEVEFGQLANDRVVVQAGRARFRLAAAAPDQYPAIAAADLAIVRTLAAAPLREAIDRVAFAITREESRYALSGAHMEVKGSSVRLVATDGHRLSLVNLQATGEGRDVKALLPKKGLAELRRLIAGGDDPVSFGEDENVLQFRRANRVITSRKLSGAFPNYELVVPKNNPGEVSVTTAALAAALRRVVLVSDERSHAVRFDVATGLVKISASSSDIGEATEPVVAEGGDLEVTVGFNATFLLDVLGVANAERVNITYKDSNSSMLVSPVGGESAFSAIIMPLRLP